LAVPIFIFLFERRFKVLETYEESLRERRANIVKERREKRLEILERIFFTWKTFFDLIHKVVYFDPTSADASKNIKELLVRTWKLQNDADEVISELMHRFPTIELDKEVEALVHMMNQLLDPTVTIAHLIEDELEKKSNNKSTNVQEIKDLQLSLKVILDLLKTVHYYPFIEITKLANKRLLIIEEKMLQENLNPDYDKVMVDQLIKLLPEERRKDIEAYSSEIADRRVAIECNIQAIQEELKKHMEAPVDTNGTITPEVLTKYRDAFETLKQYVATADPKTIKKSKPYTDFQSEHQAMPHALLVSSTRYNFTSQGIKNFADWCSFKLEVRRTS
jgi:hypothetical protein